MGTGVAENAHPGRALIVEPGYTRGALTAVRALAGAGWEVGVGTPNGTGLAAASRHTARRHRIPAPEHDLEGFVTGINTAAATHAYEVVFPGGDAELMALSLRRADIGATVPYPPHEQVTRALDKLALDRAAREAGLATPRTGEATAETLNDWAMPAIIKSRLHAPLTRPGGPGRLEACVANDHPTAMRHVERILAAGGAPMIQERVRGRLLALTMVVDRTGRPLARAQQVADHIFPPAVGISARAVTVAVDNTLAECLEDLFLGLGWFGLAELQFVLPERGEPLLIDLNGRFYGSMALAVAAGPNLPALWASLATARPTQPQPDAAPGFSYQWLEGDLRRALAERRGGLVRDLAGCLWRSRRAVHSIWSAADPGPAVNWTRAVPRRLRKRAGARRSTHPAAPAPALTRPTRYGAEAEVVSDGAGLERLEPEWRALAELRGNAFLTPDWFQAWLRHFGEAEPAVVAVRDSTGGLLGILPLVAMRSGTGRALRFAGANLGDHHHPVALAADESTVAAAAARALHDERALGRWRTVVLDNVSTDAGWWRAITTSGADRLTATAYRHDVLPSIDLSRGSWQGYLAGRSHNLRSQLRRRTRALAEGHGATFRMTGDPEDLERDLATFFALHDARWESRGGSSLASPRARAFHRDFAAAALEHGWLRLWLLEAESVPIAAWYGWRIGRRYAYYSAGFAPDWEARSPGFVLLGHTIRAAAEEGASEYDLLRGAEAYKTRFATAERGVQTVVLARSRDPVRLVVGAESVLWRFGRRMPDGLQRPGRAAYRALAGRTPTGRPR